MTTIPYQPPRREYADQIAGELGYHRADTCGGWDE